MQVQNDEGGYQMFKEVVELEGTFLYPPATHRNSFNMMGWRQFAFVNNKRTFFQFEMVSVGVTAQ